MLPGLCGHCEDLAVVARTGKTRPGATDVITEEKQRISVTICVEWEMAVMVSRINAESRSRFHNAMRVLKKRFVEDQRMRFDVADAEHNDGGCHTERRGKEFSEFYTGKDDRRKQVKIKPALLPVEEGIAIVRLWFCG